MHKIFSLTLTAGLVGVAGCQGQASSDNSATTAAAPVASTAAAGSPASGTPSMAQQAEQLFAQRCAMCHGKTGRGDGMAVASMKVKPANFADPAWQAAAKDEDLKKIIIGGGKAVGKNFMMPPNPYLGSKPEMLEEIVKLVRGFSGTK